MLGSGPPDCFFDLLVLGAFLDPPPPPSCCMLQIEMYFLPVFKAKKYFALVKSMALGVNYENFSFFSYN